MPDLTGNTALDVAIGLAFTYLLFSLLCSAIQEAIAGVLDLRAKKLEAGLRSMLEDGGHGTGGAPVIPGSTPTTATAPPGGGGPWSTTEMSPAALVALAAPDATAPAGAPKGSPSLVDQLLAHDLIRSAYKESLSWRVGLGRRLGLRGRRGPSYLAPRSFAVALMDLLAPSQTGSNPLRDIEQQIQLANLPAGTKSTLLTMVKKVATDRDHLRAVIEQWFDDTMARVSGWYKRQAQIILCVIAAAVTIGLNVNTLAIGERLVHDDSVRSYLVEQATKSPPPEDATFKDLGRRITKAHTLGLPFGWSEEADNPAKVCGHFWRTLAGWLLTFIALSLGAPFWFDALSKLARLRVSGVPEAPHEQAPRKDSPTSVVKTETKKADGSVETTTTTTLPG